RRAAPATRAGGGGRPSGDASGRRSARSRRARPTRHRGRRRARGPERRSGTSTAARPPRRAGRPGGRGRTSRSAARSEGTVAPHGPPTTAPPVPSPSSLSSGRSAVKCVVERSLRVLFELLTNPSQLARQPDEERLERQLRREVELLEPPPGLAYRLDGPLRAQEPLARP